MLIHSDHKAADCVVVSIPCYSVNLIPKYFTEHHFLIQPHPVSLLYYDKPSVTLIQEHCCFD